MDTHQVAHYLRLKERKIYDLVKEKRIPCVRVTGKWLFPKAEIDSWLQSNVDGAVPQRPQAVPPLVVAGSHDPLLEWCLRRLDGPLAILPGTSTDGLARLAAGDAVMAGLHLIDSETGEFNIAQTSAMLSQRNVVLIEWAWRDQGLVVAAGNPLNLTSLEDLASRRPRLVMRQEGAGARALLERLLNQAGIGPKALTLAGIVARSETEVGMAVMEGQADAGLAVASVAGALKLDFVPLFRERFDLAIDRRAFFDPPLQRLFAFTKSDEFRAKAAALGGYDVTGLGMVHWNAD
ncbi:MAG TPA: helix-turn-helix transcriptional regulator [Rhodospirillaceae bacterium]|nr:helix-turn-helix transcriptional regulator [Rhodospirillaceae bacterium]